jgi:hypothetical protein
MEEKEGTISKFNFIPNIRFLFVFNTLLRTADVKPKIMEATANM